MAQPLTRGSECNRAKLSCQQRFQLSRQVVALWSSCAFLPLFPRSCAGGKRLKHMQVMPVRQAFRKAIRDGGMLARGNFALCKHQGE